MGPCVPVGDSLPPGSAGNEFSEFHSLSIFLTRGQCQPNDSGCHRPPEIGGSHSTMSRDPREMRKVQLGEVRPTEKLHKSTSTRAKGSGDSNRREAVYGAAPPFWAPNWRSWWARVYRTANFSLGGPAVRSPVWWANVSCTANFSLGGHPVGCDHLSATRIQAPEDQKAALLSLEAAVIEIQSATILGDCPHDLLRRTVRYVGLYLQSQSNVRSQQTRKVSNHFIRYLACVPTDSRGVQLYRPVVTPGRQVVE